jgi:hypothetical protein
MARHTLTPGDGELVAQHEDLGVLPPCLPARQAQQRHGTGNDQEDQLQAHKPKIIPPPAGPRQARAHAERSTALCRAFAQVFGTLNRLKRIQYRPGLIEEFLAQTGLSIEPEPP